MKKTAPIMNFLNKEFILIIFFVGIISFTFPSIVEAQPGTLDSNFNKTGKVINSEDSLQPYCSALQKDGKIIVAGQGKGVELIRYNNDGSKDLSFGVNGKVITDLGSYLFFSPEARAIAVQDDGKIIAVGGGFRLVLDPYSKADYDILLLRYNEDGSLDNSFGNNGVVISDFGDYELSEEAFCVALQTDGKIVIGGTSDLSWFIARYLLNGNLDNAFSDDGWIRTKYLGLDRANSILIQPDGKIVAAGKTGSTALKSQFILTRYLSNGVSRQFVWC